MSSGQLDQGVMKFDPRCLQGGQALLWFVLVGEFNKVQGRRDVLKPVVIPTKRGNVRMGYQRALGSDGYTKEAETHCIISKRAFRPHPRSRREMLPCCVTRGCGWLEKGTRANKS